MKRIVVFALLAVLAWQGYVRYLRTGARGGEASVRSPVPHGASQLQTSQPANAGFGAFKCDGRTYCSQMTSCAEANYFLKNCPGVKMDGNHDGIPCEKQWCR